MMKRFDRWWLHLGVSLQKLPPWLSLISGAVAVFSPKCPLCLAACLSWSGTTGAILWVLIPWVRPMAMLLLVVSICVWLGVRVARQTCSSRED